MQENIIEIENLTTILQEKEVHKGLNLKVKKGEILVVIGGSGAGKSFLFKNIVGLMKPREGKIVVKGVDITKVSSKELDNLRKYFGVVFQGGGLFDSLSVFENIAFRLRRQGGFKEEEIKRIVCEKLEQVGLSQDITDWMVEELSGGMRKRVGLARAIATEVEIVLYDEPTTGLDPIMTDIINDLIKTLQLKLNVTSLVVTHDMESAFFIADRIAILCGGKILGVGSSDEIRGSGDEYIQQFINGESKGVVI